MTECHSNSTSERKISEGSANVPTNVLRPFDSAFVMMFRRPARYLKVIFSIDSFVDRKFERRQREKIMFAN